MSTTKFAFATLCFCQFLHFASCFHFECSRKVFLGRHAGAAIVAFGATAVQPNNAKAATTPTPAELEKLRKGHSRIKFLLENWDSETQVRILRVFVIDSVTQIHPSYLATKFEQLRSAEN